MAAVDRLRAVDLVYLVCAVHLSVCIAQIVCTPGNEPWRIGSVVVSQTLQWINTSFCCVSIISIIAAGVGALYLIERHLNIYFYVLLLSALGDVVILTLFIIHGMACETLVPDAQIEKSSVTCKFTETGTVILLAILIIFKLISMAIVSKARKVIRIKYGEELLPHMKQSLQQSFSKANFGGDFGDFGFGGDMIAEDEAFEATQLATGGMGGEAGDYGSAALRSRMVSRPPAPLSAPIVGAAPVVTGAYPSVGAMPAMRSAPAAVLPSQLPPAPFAAAGPQLQPVLAA